MKAIFLSALYPPNTKGGGEVSTHLIARGLIDRGHEVRVITSGEKREEGVVDGVPVLRLPLPMTAKPLLERRHAGKIARELKKEIEIIVRGESDSWIVHAHDFRSALALSELGYKQAVATVRDYAQICGTTNAILWDGGRCTCSWHDVVRANRVKEASLLRKPFRIWQYKYNIGYRRQAFRKLAHQIFISDAQQKEISRQQDLSGVKTTVIYNPVPEEYLAHSVAAGVQGTVLYVGRVEMYKGVGMLLEAWRQLAKDNPQAHLKIVGEGAQRLDYERLVESWGLQYRVTFTGRVPWDRLRPIYDEASVVVAPHIWIEPFGRTVVEGLARGKVVLAADAGGPAEVIQHKVSGLLFERGSTEALANCLAEALIMPELARREMQRAARRWVQEHLTSDFIAQQYEQFYQQLR